MPKTVKAPNPEEKLQESVARESKLRQLEDHARLQAEATSAAKWELSFYEKEEKASKQRNDSQILEDSRAAKITNTIVRRQRLEALYQDDEIRYEDELRMRGLALRRERL
jgi:hypothetical protein